MIGVRVAQLIFVVALGLILWPPMAVAGQPPTVTPTPQVLRPLDMATDNPSSTIRGLPLLAVHDQFRQAGLVNVIASADFNTGAIGALDPAVELLQDSALDDVVGRVIAVRVPDERVDSLLEQLRVTPGVLAADKSILVPVATNDPYWSAQMNYGLVKLNIPQAWLVSSGIPSVRVAVIDTGVNAITDLAGRVDPGINTFDPADPNTTGDVSGHGTRVAAIIAATANNHDAIAGVAPKVRIVPVKPCEVFLGLGGLPFCPPTLLNNALQWVTGEALAGRVDVVNMSLGGPDWDATTEYWLGQLKSLGVIISVAAGNDGTSPLYYPGRSSHVVGVGGATWNGLTLERDPDSNYGDGLDVLAPFETYAPNNAGVTVSSAGTSFSAPVIAGLAALFKSTQPLCQCAEVSYFNNTDRFLAMLRVSTTGYRTWNEEMGYGMPDAFHTIWWASCTRLDFNFDRVIDVIDDQMQAYRYGGEYGNILYDMRFDLEPFPKRDYDIDIKDLTFLWNRNGTCPE